MQVRVKRVDKELPLPVYQSAGAVAFDLVARERVVFAVGDVKLVPANVVVEVPEGYVLVVAARSSLPIKRGLVVANGIGVIDRDYCGPADEVHVQMAHLGVNEWAHRTIFVERGERIAQGLILPCPRVELVEVDDLATTSRGGFGSTGGYRTLRAGDMISEAVLLP